MRETEARAETAEMAAASASARMAEIEAESRASKAAHEADVAARFEN